MNIDKEKLNILLKEYDMSNNEFAERFIIDSIVPAICMNENCDATYEYEPDQDKGWCEECKTNSVKSGLILIGLT